MIKSAIARLIIRHFKGWDPYSAFQGLSGIDRGYRDEYMSEKISSARKERIDEGYDYKLHTIVDPKNYSVEMLQGDAYHKDTVRNIALEQHKKIEKFKTADTNNLIMENEALTKENERLKNQVRELEIQNKGLRDLIRELKISQPT